MGVCRGYVGVFIDSPEAHKHMICHHYAKEWRGSVPSAAVALQGAILLILASMDGPGIPIPYHSILWSSILAQRLRVRLYPSKFVTPIVWRLAKIRDLPIFERWQFPPPPHPPLPADWYGSKYVRSISRIIGRIEKKGDIVKDFFFF